MVSVPACLAAFQGPVPREQGDGVALYIVEAG